MYELVSVDRLDLSTYESRNDIAEAVNNYIFKTKSALLSDLLTNKSDMLRGLDSVSELKNYIDNIERTNKNLKEQSKSTPSRPRLYNQTSIGWHKLENYSDSHVTIGSTFRANYAAYAGQASTRAHTERFAYSMQRQKMRVMGAPPHFGKSHSTLLDTLQFIQLGYYLKAYGDKSFRECFEEFCQSAEQQSLSQQYIRCVADAKPSPQAEKSSSQMYSEPAVKRPQAFLANHSAIYGGRGDKVATSGVGATTSEEKTTSRYSSASRLGLGSRQ